MLICELLAARCGGPGSFYLETTTYQWSLSQIRTTLWGGQGQRQSQSQNQSPWDIERPPSTVAQFSLMNPE